MFNFFYLLFQMSSKTSHKAMGDADWLKRLQMFADTGVWPASEGNRPAPRQKKWHRYYQMVKQLKQTNTIHN